MSNQGWIKIHRKILEWEWYDEPNTFRLFFHLLLKANHKSRNYRGVLIKEGQIMTGLNTLSDETGMSVQRVRTSLERLKSTNEITIKSSNKGTIIQIVKYGDYQLTTDKPTNEQQTNNKPTTTNKNVKNEKEFIKEEVWLKFQPWIKDNQLNKDKVYAQFDKAWFYYEDLEWKNKNNKQVINPVSTIRNNWFKELDEYKLSRREINDLRPALTTIYTDGR